MWWVIGALAIVVAASLVKLALRGGVPPRGPENDPSTPPTPEEIAEQLRRIRALERAAFKPITTDGEGEPTGSRFGGRPAMLPDEPWPICASCNQPMHFFAQINLSTAPRPRKSHGPVAVDAPASGLLQAFACLNLGCSMMREEPVNDWSCVRTMPAQHLASLVPRRGCEFPPKQVTRWQELRDVPEDSHAVKLGAGVTPAALDAVYGKHWSVFKYAHDRDKLFGWPYWVQGWCPTPCPACGREMQFLLQIAGEDNTPHMFGDDGIALVHVCPDHPDRGSFRWNCY